MAPTSPPPGPTRNSRPVSLVSNNRNSRADHQNIEIGDARRNTVMSNRSSQGYQMSQSSSASHLQAPASPYFSAADHYQQANSTGTNPRNSRASGMELNSNRPPTRATFDSGVGSFYTEGEKSPSTPDLYAAGGIGAGAGAQQYYSQMNATPAYRHKPTPSKEYGALEDGGKIGSATRGGGFKGFVKRRPIVTTLIALLILAIIGVGVGIGVSKGMSSNSAGNTSNNLANANTPSSATSTKGSTPMSSSSGAAAPSATAVVLDSSGNNRANITQMPFWDFTDPNQKVIGVSLGNWLVLERWMDEDWFVAQAGGNAWDEWGFMQSVGDRAASILEDHWNTWVVESDLDTLLSVGVNHIRIPVGYWAFIPTAGAEPFRNFTQLDHLEQMLGWLYKRNMRALIDLHGMPGSQNGDQSSGHNTTNPTWFNDYNQGRSDQCVDAVISWIQSNPYRSVITGVAPANEPVGPGQGTDAKWQVVQNFYDRSYTKLRAANLPSFMHHAFVADPPNYWRAFMSSKDPKYATLNDNPYGGYFPAIYDQNTIIERACQKANSYVGFPVSVVMTEWSVVSGITDTGFETSYYATQLSAYSWSAGQFFWNIKTKTATNPVLAAPAGNQVQYSFLDMIAKGVVPTIQTNQTGLAYIQSLPNPGCGPIQQQTFGN